MWWLWFRVVGVAVFPGWARRVRGSPLGSFDRVRRVVAVNAYDYAGGIGRSSLLARLIVTGVIAPGVGPLLAGLEPKPVMRAILSGGLGDRTALRDDYLEELLNVGRHTGYPVARGVYRNLPSLSAARARYPMVTAPIHLIYGEQDWSRPSDRQANRRQLPEAGFTEVPRAGHSSPWNGPTCPPTCSTRSHDPRRCVRTRPHQATAA